MHDLSVAAGLPDWKLTLLVTMTLMVVAAAHVHSARAAWREMRQKQLPTIGRQVLSYLVRHEKHYVKHVPMMIMFVLAAVVVVVEL
jgi:hypothetical protein